MPKHIIQDKTIMVRISWNPLRFHMLDALPKDRTFDAEHYHDNTLRPLVSLYSEAGENTIVVHADNASAIQLKRESPFVQQTG
jgi:hypothetical protein